jgi:transcriptional regulator with XRE-family HTH domain
MEVLVSSGRDLARALTDRRRELGLTQEQVAARMGVTQPAVSVFERPGSNPTAAAAERYAAAVGADLAWLLAPPGWVALPQVARPPRVALDLPRLRALVAGFGPDRGKALYEAARMIGPVAVSSMLAGERLHLPMSAIRAVYDGISADGDPLAVWRCVKLCDLQRAAALAAAADREPPLAIQTPAGVVVGPAGGDPLDVALRWAAQALALGASETDVWLAANTRLVWSGLPWLMVQTDNQRRFLTLAKLMATKDATDYLAVYLADLATRSNWWA